MTRQMRWQYKQQALGNCTKCGKARVPESNWYCEKHHTDAKTRALKNQTNKGVSSNQAEPQPDMTPKYIYKPRPSDGADLLSRLNMTDFIQTNNMEVNIT